MRFQGAVVREQGMTFAIAVVKRHVIESRATAAETIRSFMPVSPGMPIVLMAQDGRGRPTNVGRPDIARFLANVPLRAILWREYSLN